MNEHAFDGKGKLYAASRPDYPEKLFDSLYEAGLLTPDTVAADIGSGTGLFSVHLAEKARLVYAVEPNEDMRRTAEGYFGNRPNILSVCGSAENTGLTEKINLITAAEAFHWFDRAAFRDECRRIQKKDGAVVLVWNVLRPKEELTARIAALHRKYCARFKGFSGGTDFENETFSDSFAAPPEKRLFDNRLFYDKQTFLQRILSSSFALTGKDENFAPYIAEFEELFDTKAQAGRLIMPYQTICFIGNI